MRTSSAVVSASVLALAAASSPALAQHLLVPDKAGDRLMLFDASSGRVIDADFIVPPAGTLVATVEAIQVGDEVWVSEPGLDAVKRLSMDGNVIATMQPFTYALDRPSGMATDGSTVLVTNRFLAKHLAGSWITRLSSGGANLGTFDAFNDAAMSDILFADGVFYVANSSDRTIERVTATGAHLGIFASLEQDIPFSNPAQVAPAPGGGLLVASNNGIMRLGADGVLVERLLPETWIAGVWPLEDGRLMFTTSFGVYRLEPGGQVVTILDGPLASFVAPLSGATACAADFAAPLGALDFSDVTGFLSLFAGGDPNADLAPPFAQLDFSDVVEFLALFGQGCP